MANKVLKADCAAVNNSYVEKDFGASHPDIWVTFRMRFSAAALAFWEGLTYPPSAFPVFESLNGAADDQVESFGIAKFGTWQWTDFWANGGIPIADAWLTVEHHFTNCGAIDIYVNAALVISTTDLNCEDIQFLQLGQQFNGPLNANDFLYFDDVKVGTTRGASNIFADDFESGGLAAWTSIVGDCSVVDDPFPPPPTPPEPSPGQSSALASIAFFSQAFDPTPGWNGPLSDLKTVQIDRGRNYLLSKTQTGTMVLGFLGSDGRYDPTNRSSPYYPEIGPMRAAKVELVNPVDHSRNRLFTGFTEIWDFAYPMTPSAALMDAAVHCVDGFDALNRAELPPDSANRTTIPPFVGADAVGGRIIYVLSFFSGAPYSGNGFPTDVRAIFSGNVNVLSGVYNPQTSLLTPIQDTADAEFPNVSNVFMDKFGNLAFRGRATRFTPENYWTGSANAPTLAKPISFWNVGDANACLTWPTNPPGSPSAGAMAPFNDLGWDLDQTSMVNACECYPGSIGTQTAAITNQLRTNGASILKYGPRVLSIPDLYTGGSPALTGNPFLNPPGLSAKQETLLYADYFVQNLAVPEPHISMLKFVTVAPGTARGNAWWNLVCGVEIGDVIVLYVTDPGGGGFQAEQFFVEGIHYQIEIGGPYPQITMTLDVSPRKWFAVFNGFTFFPTNGFMAQDGQVTHNSTSFQSASFTFAPGNVGDRVTILDLATPAVPGVNPQQFTVAAYVSAHHVTLSSPFTGTTTSVAPWEIIGA